MKNEYQNPQITTIFAIILGIFFLLVLIYIIYPSLSPLVILAGLIFTMYPFRENQLIRRFLWLGVILFCVWFFDVLTSILTPFIIAFVLAYIMNPLVNRLESKYIPRWLSALVLIGLAVGILLTFFIFVLPGVFLQFQDILNDISFFAVSSIEYIKNGALFNTLKAWGVPVESISQTIEKNLPSGAESILTRLLQGASNFLSNISSIVAQILNIVLIPFVTFYILKDFPQIINAISSFVPEGKRPGFRLYFEKVDTLLGQYFRGAVIVAIIQGVIATVVLTILGVRYAGVLGIMTALLDFIPYVGLIISLVVAVVVATFSGDPVVAKVIGVIIMYVTQKIIENTVLAPKIIGKKVGLHPVLLMISLFVFGYFFGFVGLLIAVPLTAVLVMTIDFWKEQTIPGSTLTGGSG